LERSANAKGVGKKEIFGGIKELEKGSTHSRKKDLPAKKVTLGAAPWTGYRDPRGEKQRQEGSKKRGKTGHLPAGERRRGARGEESKHHMSTEGKKEGQQNTNKTAPQGRSMNLKIKKIKHEKKSSHQTANRLPGGQGFAGKKTGRGNQASTKTTREGREKDLEYQLWGRKRQSLPREARVR